MLKDLCVSYDVVNIIGFVNGVFYYGREIWYLLFFIIFIIFYYLKIGGVL